MEASVVKPLLVKGEVWASCQGREPVFYYSGGIPSISERRVIREMLRPFDLVQSDPDRMPTVDGKPVWILCAQLAPEGAP